MQRGKKYKEVSKKVDKNKVYSIEEASKLLPEISTSKFAGSVEVSIKLEAKSKKQNESVKGSIVLPHQTGASKKVAVIAEAKDQDTAKKAGADKVGAEDLIKEISEGKIDFDVLIATPVMMPKIAGLGKVLGPKGLLPNPKNETVTTNVEKVVKSYKAGKLDFKMKEGLTIQAKVANTAMKPEEIKDNVIEFLKAVYSESRNLSAKPLAAVTLKPTMGPALKVDVNEIYS
jgi:large subunit ribosomal protein L1